MPLLVIAFIVVPLVELFVIIEVGGLIGILPTLALLLLFSVLGAVLLAAQGRAAWARFREALAERRMPHKEVFDGALIVFGGALLLTPGFITDSVGLLCLLPPSRAAIRRLLSGLLIGRLGAGARVATWGFGRYGNRSQGGPKGPSGSGSRHYDVEGAAHEVDESEGQGSAGADAGLPAPESESSERP